MRATLISIMILSVLGLNVNGQSFEGRVTYKVEMHNPNSEMVPDSLWKQIITQQFGEQGFMLQKYRYKLNRYMSEIEGGNNRGFQTFSPKDGLLYSWAASSDTAVTVSSKKYLDEFIGFDDSDQIDTILGIPCRSVTLNSSLGKMTIWFNSDYFKMDAKFYKGHVYGHWEQMLKKMGCLPLKIEQKNFMAHMVQTMVDYEETAIDDAVFDIPKFKTVLENPIN